MKKFLQLPLRKFLSVGIILLFFFLSSAWADSLIKKASPGEEKSALDKSLVLKKSEQEKILGQIRQKYSRAEAFSGRFTQKTTYVDTNETTLSMGRIWIQGPDKMRWEYKIPGKQLLVSDGKTIWYYTPDLNQVMLGKVKEIKEARVLVNLLAKLKPVQKGLQLELNRTSDRLAVKLQPQIEDKAPPFKSLEIIFSAADLMLKETRMEDLFANKIVITYKWESGPDPTLPAAHFSFIPPQGCDVMPLGQ
ncbi:outer membrane lipoprotein chaperone LolA [bacterium]|nr:outer membrane lipoprotein chaperone LolA [bacterium]